MNFNLTIQSEDLPFIIEAIKLRTMSLISNLEMQVRDIKQARQAIEKAQATPTEVVKEAIEAKVIPNQQKRDFVASFEKELRKAPYGYKKDGTPKKRAGRPRIDELPF
jgi:formaldehyde-activating enzyme involved in methanogenesis